MVLYWFKLCLNFLLTTIFCMVCVMSEIIMIMKLLVAKLSVKFV